MLGLNFNDVLDSLKSTVGNLCEVFEQQVEVKSLDQFGDIPS